MVPDNKPFRILGIEFFAIVATAAYAQNAPTVTKVGASQRGDAQTANVVSQVVRASEGAENRSAPLPGLSSSSPSDDSTTATRQRVPTDSANLTRSFPVQSDTAHAPDDGGGVPPLAGQCLTSGACSNFINNYPTGTLSTTSPTFTTVATDIYGGEYAFYSVTSGSTYEWTLCSGDGASASYDSQLTLWNQNGTTRYCYSDNYCDDDANISWTATITGTVVVLVSKYNCANNSTDTTLRWRRASVALPPDIRVLPASLPFTCTSTVYDATSEEYEAGFQPRPQWPIDSAEKSVDPDGVIATRPAAGDGQVQVIVSPGPTETGALTGLGEASETQIPDEAHAGIVSAPKTAHRQAEFTRLKAVAWASGSVPVVVELAVPNIVVLTSRSSVAATQAGIVQADGALSAAIAAVARAELAGLAAVPHSPGRVFPYIPFMSLSASERALEILEASPIVLDIDEDRLVEPTLDNTVNIIEASNAWARGFDGAGWYVAIIDTGIRASHNFFAGKPIVEACFALGQDGAGGAGDCPNGLSTDTSPPPAHPAQPYPSTFCGYDHGTHVAGIAAGSDPPRVPPLYGVARGANVIAVKVFSKFTSRPPCDANCPNCLQSWNSDVIAGLNHVYSLRLAYNIAAVNMSLGGGGPYNDQTSCDNNNSATKSILDSLRTAGVATVIATGNSGFCNGISAPACISSAIAVGAVNDADSEAGFNNYGALLDLFAPGISILSSVASSDTAYLSFSGTSMAAPHVTGAWAILKQACPSATVTEAFNALQGTGAVIANACTGSGIYPQRRIRIDTAIDALCDQCSGESFTIFNDGGSTLEVTSIDKSSWAQLSPLPPYSIVGGASRQVCVTIDCAACVGAPLDGTLTINSNDLDESAVNVGVHVDCPSIVVPTVMPWESVITHTRSGQTPIEVPLDIRDNANCTGAGLPYACCTGAGTGTCTGSFSEPRSGVKKLVVTFTGPLDPATVIPANVTVCGNSAPPIFSPVDLSGVVVTTSTTSGDTQMVINFAPALPDFARYRIALTSAIHGANGGAIQPVSRILTALQGDFTGDRRVNATDVGGIRSLVPRDPINLAILNEVRGDANNDKRINATDVGGARSLSGNDARTIPDPVCP